MTQTGARFPIGISDFRNVREDGFTYVDKTTLIDDVLNESALVLLVPRPRRFGKTLNLSMLRYFFAKNDPTTEPQTTSDASAVRSLFDGLAIQASSSAWAHFQRYPVIFMTFKDVKPTSRGDCMSRIAGVIADAFEKHSYLLTEGDLDPADVELFVAIRELRAPKAWLTTALKLLSRLLARYHREKVVILIDEYDTPIHASQTNTYYDDVVAFVGGLLSSSLKDNSHLFKGVLTGILRVAEESLISGINNVAIYSILHARFATAFGFTEAEVRSLAEAAGCAEAIDGIRAFYGGYLFGGQAIYNPWSVLSFLDSEDHAFRPYWIEASSTDQARDLLLTGPRGVSADLETLLAGGSIEKRIDENIVLRDISSRLDAVWSFLLFTGYLKATDVTWADGRQRARLAAPNAEVSLALADMAHMWLEDQAGGSNEANELLSAVLRGDAPVVERYLAKMVKVNVSFFDTASPEPERFYHGLVVGLLAGLAPRYEVRSNRESGYGRCDVMILPKEAGAPGVVLELKSVDADAGETTEKAFLAAFRQIRERDYAAELRERGATPIHRMAAVFEGKRVFVRVAGEKRAARKTTAPTKTKAKPATKKAAPVRKGARQTGKRTAKK